MSESRSDWRRTRCVRMMLVLPLRTARRLRRGPMGSMSPQVQTTLRGPTEAACLQLAFADALRARSNGYAPVSQSWGREGDQVTLAVVYELVAAPASATPPPFGQPVGPPAVPDAPASGQVPPPSIAPPPATPPVPPAGGQGFVHAISSAIRGAAGFLVALLVLIFIILLYTGLLSTLIRLLLESIFGSG